MSADATPGGGVSPADDLSRPPPPTTDFYDSESPAMSATPAAGSPAGDEAGSPANARSPADTGAPALQQEPQQQQQQQESPRRQPRTPTPEQQSPNKRSPKPQQQAESPHGSASSAESPNRRQTALSAKAEAARPAPLASPPPQSAPAQPQQPVSHPQAVPQPQQPVQSPQQPHQAAPQPASMPRQPSGPPPIIQHVKDNFGDVLGEVLEREVYRRGWVECEIEELHQRLREHSGNIYQTLQYQLGHDQLGQAVLQMLRGILQFHHHESTDQIVMLLQQNCNLPVLFNAMLNPAQLKGIVETLIQQQQQQHARAQQSRGGGSGAGGAGGAAPFGGAYNRSGPNPAAVFGESPTGYGPGGMPSRGTPPQASTRQAGGSRGSPQPRGATSPTSPNPPAPRSQQQAQARLLQQQQQQQGVDLGQPQVPTTASSALDQQRRAMERAQQNLQQSMKGPGSSMSGRPAPGALHADGMYDSGNFPSNGGTPSGPSSHAAAQQPPTPSSTTSSVPFSPLAAAFSAARQPKAAAQPTAQQQQQQAPAPAAAGKSGGRGATLAEGLQALVSSGGRSGRISMDGGSAMVMSGKGGSGSLSWADTAEEEQQPRTDPDLVNFLRHNGLDALVEPLTRHGATLRELRAMGEREFEQTGKRLVSLSSARNKLWQALHPNGRAPAERKSWLLQQQQQQQGQEPAAPTGGIPAPRSRNSGPDAAQPQRTAAEAQPRASGRGNASYGAAVPELLNSTEPLYYLRLRLIPEDPDSPQPTDMAFQREVLPQLQVRGAVWLAIAWSAMKGMNSQAPTIVFALKKEVADEVRALQMRHINVQNVRYAIEKCSAGPNLPKSIDIHESHPLYHRVQPHRSATAAVAPAPAAAPVGPGRAGPSSQHHASYAAASAPGADAHRAGALRNTRRGHHDEAPVQPAASGPGARASHREPPAAKSPKAAPARAQATPPQRPARASAGEPAGLRHTPDQGPSKPKSTPPAGPSQPCRFYGLPSGCRRGVDCTFRHDEAVAAANLAGAARSKNTTDSFASADGSHTSMPARGRGRGRHHDPAAADDGAGRGASQPRDAESHPRRRPGRGAAAA